MLRNPWVDPTRDLAVQSCAHSLRRFPSRRTVSWTPEGPSGGSSRDQSARSYPESQGLSEFEEARWRCCKGLTHEHTLCARLSRGDEVGRTATGAPTGLVCRARPTRKREAAMRRGMTMVLALALPLAVSMGAGAQPKCQGSLAGRLRVGIGLRCCGGARCGGTGRGHPIRVGCHAGRCGPSRSFRGHPGSSRGPERDERRDVRRPPARPRAARRRAEGSDPPQPHSPRPPQRHHPGRRRRRIPLRGRLQERDVERLPAHPRALRHRRPGSVQPPGRQRSARRSKEIPIYSGSVPPGDHTIRWR